MALLPALFLALLSLTTAPAARAAQDVPAAIARCQELVPGFDEHPGPVLSEVQGNPDKVLGVRLTWKRSDGDHAEDWIICWFLPISETNGLWQIDEVQTKNHGMMIRYDVQQLYKMLWLRTHDNAQRLAPVAATAPTW